MWLCKGVQSALLFMTQGLFHSFPLHAFPSFLLWHHFNAPHTHLYMLCSLPLLCFCHIINIQPILFSLQFLGNTEVEAPKGTEVVKDAVRKLKVKLLLTINCYLKGQRSVFVREGVSDKCSPSLMLLRKVPLEFFSICLL